MVYLMCCLMYFYCQVEKYLCRSFKLQTLILLYKVGAILNYIIHCSLKVAWFPVPIICDLEMHHSKTDTVPPLNAIHWIVQLLNLIKV